MKILIFCLLFLVVSCQLIKDRGTSPSSLNQMRLVMESGNSKYVGVAYSNNASENLSFRVFGEGTYNVRGFGSCGTEDSMGGGIFNGSFNSKTKWINLDVRSIGMSDVCIFSIEVKPNKFDSNMSGIYYVTPFNNPDILPLKTEHSGFKSDGVIAFQISEESQEFTDEEKSNAIREDRYFSVYPKSLSGTLKIKSSCKTKNETYSYTEIPYERESLDRPVVVSLEKIYSDLGGIHRSCSFSVLVNPIDSMKEMSNVFVSVYKSLGSWLPAPLVSKNAIGQTCFEFMDEYTVGIGVNKNDQFKKKLCETDGPFEVFGVTSNLRLFYGVYNNGQWEFVK